MANVVKITGGTKYKIALEAISKKVAKAGTLRMGFLEGKMYPDSDTSAFLKAVGSSAAPTHVNGLPVAQVAFWNEYGTKTTPARPAFRTTIVKSSPSWGTTLGKALVHYKYDGERALRVLGQDMRDDLENTIATWTTPGNAPLTIKIKGFNKPLVGVHGILQRAPDYEIVK